MKQKQIIDEVLSG